MSAPSDPGSDPERREAPRDRGGATRGPRVLLVIVVAWALLASFLYLVMRSYAH